MLTDDYIALLEAFAPLHDVGKIVVSERCCKKPMTPDQTCRIIEEDAGKHFDPQLAKVFLYHRDEFEKSRKVS